MKAESSAGHISCSDAVNLIDEPCGDSLLNVSMVLLPDIIQAGGAGRGTAFPTAPKRAKPLPDARGASNRRSMGREVEKLGFLGPECSGSSACFPTRHPLYEVRSRVCP